MNINKSKAASYFASPMWHIETPNLKHTNLLRTVENEIISNIYIYIY